MTTAPVSRQPACGGCGHEVHILRCDWCLCDTSPVVGVYLDPWPVYAEPLPD